MERVSRSIRDHYSKVSASMSLLLAADYRASEIDGSMMDDRLALEAVEIGKRLVKLSEMKREYEEAGRRG